MRLTRLDFADPPCAVIPEGSLPCRIHKDGRKTLGLLTGASPNLQAVVEIAIDSWPEIRVRRNVILVEQLDGDRADAAGLIRWPTDGAKELVNEAVNILGPSTVGMASPETRYIHLDAGEKQALTPADGNLQIPCVLVLVEDVRRLEGTTCRSLFAGSLKVPSMSEERKLGAPRQL